MDMRVSAITPVTRVQDPFKHVQKTKIEHKDKKQKSFNEVLKSFMK